MKKRTVLMLSLMLAASMATACGKKNDTASAPAEQVEQADQSVKKGAPAKKAERVTYRLVEYNASGYVMKGAELKDNGMGDNTYAELGSDGTGVVCIMGAANDITWDSKGSIKINNYPTYTLKQIDDETIEIGVATSKFIMSSNDAVIAAALNSSPAEEDEEETGKPAGDFDGVKKVYRFAGIEAGGVLQDSVQAYMNTGGAYEDTSLVLNGDGTGSLFMEGDEHEVLWEDGRYEVQDMMGCGLEEIEDGMYQFDLYGMMKMRLMAEDYTNNKADRSNLKTMPYGSYDGKKYHSAGYINAAKTLMVSVFVNNDEFYWTDDEYDQETEQHILKVMKIAADWLSDKVALYGYDSQFVFNWEENPDLAYDAYVGDAELVSESMEDMIDAFSAAIKSAGVNEKALKQKYGADNVVYVLHINDGGINYTGNVGRDFSTSTDEGQEFLVLYGSYAEGAGGAVAVAHETLHCFGAPDLYELNFGNSKKITPEYISYLADINSKDIMFEASMDSFVGINFEMGPVTAYYVGLEKEAPKDVIEFGLGKAEK